MNKITKFTILGERCSGTNFLEKAISNNFNLKITWEYGWKHFFGFNSYENSHDTLFIGIVRDPYTWMNSLYRNPYHLNKNMRKHINNFLNGQFWSYYDNKSHGKNFGKEIMEDRNIYTNERYKNIFECRKVKLNFLINDMPQKVEHYILIKYEDLRDNYENTLIKIKNKFNLEFTSNSIMKITNYKGTTKRKFKINNNNPISKDKIYNHEDFNENIEKKLGYI